MSRQMTQSPALGNEPFAGQEIVFGQPFNLLGLFPQQKPDGQASTSGTTPTSLLAGGFQQPLPTDHRHVPASIETVQNISTNGHPRYDDSSLQRAQMAIFHSQGQTSLQQSQFSQATSPTAFNPQIPFNQASPESTHYLQSMTPRPTSFTPAAFPVSSTHEYTPRHFQGKRMSQYGIHQAHTSHQTPTPQHTCVSPAQFPAVFGFGSVGGVAARESVHGRPAVTTAELSMTPLVSPVYTPHFARHGMSNSMLSEVFSPLTSPLFHEDPTKKSQEATNSADDLFTSLPGSLVSGAQVNANQSHSQANVNANQPQEHFNSQMLQQAPTGTPAKRSQAQGLPEKTLFGTGSSIDIRDITPPTSTGLTTNLEASGQLGPSIMSPGASTMLTPLPGPISPPQTEAFDSFGQGRSDQSSSLMSPNQLPPANTAVGHLAPYTSGVRSAAASPLTAPAHTQLPTRSRAATLQQMPRPLAEEFNSTNSPPSTSSAVSFPPQTNQEQVPKPVTPAALMKLMRKGPSTGQRSGSPPSRERSVKSQEKNATAESTKSDIQDDKRTSKKRKASEMKEDAKNADQDGRTEVHHHHHHHHHHLVPGVPQAVKYGSGPGSLPRATPSTSTVTATQVHKRRAPSVARNVASSPPVSGQFPSPQGLGPSMLKTAKSSPPSSPSSFGPQSDPSNAALSPNTTASYHSNKTTPIALKPLLPSATPDAAHKLATRSNYENVLSGEGKQLGLSYNTPLSLTLEAKRQCHKAAEQKRRDLLKRTFEKLKTMVPGFVHGKLEDDGERDKKKRKTSQQVVSKISLLGRAVEYILFLQARDQYQTALLRSRGLSEHKAPSIGADIFPEVPPELKSLLADNERPFDVDADDLFVRFVESQHEEEEDKISPKDAKEDSGLQQSLSDSTSAMPVGGESSGANDSGSGAESRNRDQSFLDTGQGAESLCPEPVPPLLGDTLPKKESS